MDLLEALKTRRSIRRYEDRPIPHELIEKIIDAARYYPSWENTKIARYYVIDDKELVERFKNECTCSFRYNYKTIESAAAIMVVAYVKGRAGYERNGELATPKGDSWEMFDSGIAVQTLSLACMGAGIGTCILGIFDEPEIKRVLGLGDDMGISCIMTMGYPAEPGNNPRRKEVKDILNFPDKFVE